MNVLFNLETDDKFKMVTEGILNNLCNEQNKSTLILDEGVMASIKEEINDLIVKSNGDVQVINELLQSKGFNEDRIKTLSSLIEQKKAKLMYSALVNYNSIYGETIQSFNWALKLVYGTSELKNLNYPLLQLGITSVNATETKQRAYDISKEMLNKIISVLDNIETTN